MKTKGRAMSHEKALMWILIAAMSLVILPFLAKIICEILRKP